MFDFRSQKTQKILALVLLGILLIAIPLTVWYGQQQQQTQQKANVELYRGGLDSCGHIKVSQITETPSTCANNGRPDLTSYTTTAYVVSADGGTYSNVSFKWFGFFCKDKSELGGDPTNSFACLKNEQDATKTVTVTSTAQSFAVTVNPVENGVNYGACGRYQTDFVLSYTFNGKKCTFGTSPFDFSTTANVLGYGYCWAKTADCVAPSASPTPTNTPTPTLPITPTDTPTPTATPTPPEHKECRQNACVLVPNAGSDLCTTDSDCQSITPTNTPTPGPSATPTPTSNPSDTPTPTTPFVATATPKPTLPPTGPGNTLIGIGIVGAVAAVIGTIVILAL